MVFGYGVVGVDDLSSSVRTLVMCRGVFHCSIFVLFIFVCAIFKVSSVLVVQVHVVLN